MGNSQRNGASSRGTSEQDAAKTLVAALMAEQKGGALKDGKAGIFVNSNQESGSAGRAHDGGDHERDSEDEEIEDMDALNKSLSQDV